MESKGLNWMNYLFFNLKGVTQKNQKIEDHSRVLEEILQILSLVVGSNDHYTELHSIRVKDYAVRLATELQLPPRIVEEIQIGSCLHDLGKVKIPNQLLNKSGKLTEEELHLLRQHPVMGHEMLKPLLANENILSIILLHHERWDGRGYPKGISGENIPFAARVVAIADAFDAMTSNRSYRTALSVTDALFELERCSGTQFDPELAQVFIEMVQREEDIYVSLSEA